MATPTFVSQTIFAGGTGALTVAALASVQANDLILLFVESANETIATPSGYTALGTGPSTGTAAAAGGLRLQVFYKIASGADTTTTVADSGSHNGAVKVAYRGVYTTVPFNAYTTMVWASAVTSLAATAITTDRPNSKIVYVVGLDRDASSTTPTSGSAGGANITGWSTRFQEITNAGAGGGLAFGDGTLASLGSSGTPSFTLGTASIAVGYLLALNEAPPASNNTATLAATDTKDTAAIEATFAAPIFSSDTTFGSWFYGTTYTDPSISGTDFLTAKALNSGSVNLIAYYPFGARVLAPPNGSHPAYSKWQYRLMGDTTWIDAGSEVQSTTPLIYTASPYSEIPGEMFNDLTLSGLTVNSTYQFRFTARADSAIYLGAQSNAVTDLGLFPKITVISNVSGPLAVTETGSDTFAATAEVTEGSGGPAGYIDATEGTSDTFVADATVSGAIGTNATVDATETGADTAVSAVKNIAHAALAGTDAGDTALISAASTGVFKSYLLYHDFDISGMAALNQTASMVTVNTLATTAIRVKANVAGQAEYTGGVETVIFYKLWCGIQYRKVGDTPWIQAGTEHLGSALFTWHEASGSGNVFGGADATDLNRIIGGLLPATNYEVLISTRYSPDTHATPPPTLKATLTQEELDTFYTLRNDIQVELLRAATVDATETGADSFAVVATVSGNVATLAATEQGSDTIAADAEVLLQAVIAATDTADSAAVTSVVLVQADLAGIETGADSFAASVSAQPALFASLDATESGADTLVADADVLLIASISATEPGADTAALDVEVLAQSVVAASEQGQDTLAASADVLVNADLAGQETGSDSATVIALHVATALLNAAEAAADTASLSATCLVQGVLASTESGQDSLEVFAQALIQAGLETQEVGSDTLASDANVVIAAALNVAETGEDSATSTADVLVQASLSGAEAGSDTLEAFASAFRETFASLDVVETSQDSADIAVAVLLNAAISAIESGSDSASVESNVVAGAVLAAIESGQDSAASVARVIVQAVLDAVEEGHDGFEGSIGLKPYTEAYLDAYEAAGDLFAATLRAYDVDLFVQPHHCIQTILASPASVVVVSSSQAVARIARPAAPAVRVTQTDTVTVIDDDCA